MNNVEALAGIILFILKASFWILIGAVVIAAIGFIIESISKSISKSSLSEGRTIGIKVIRDPKKSTENEISSSGTFWTIIIIFLIFLLVVFFVKSSETKVQFAPTAIQQFNDFPQEENDISMETPTPTKQQYPNNVRDNFINSCIASGNGYTTKVICSCMLGNIESNYTLAEYTSLELEYRKNGEFPSEFQAIAYKNCIK